MFAASLLVPWNYWIPVPVETNSVELIVRQHEVVYLPALGNAAAPPASAPPARKKDGAPGSASGEAAQQKPFSGPIYKGPQVVISNPPRPDNYVQTIRQPDLAKAPKFPFPLRLPDVVMVAPSVPALAPQQRPSVLVVRESPQGVAAPVPLLQLSAEIPKLPPLPTGNLQAELPAPPSPPSTSVAKGAKPAQQERSAANNPDAADTRNLLVLNAVKVPVAERVAVPPGELQGAFAISPNPAAATPGAPAASSESGISKSQDRLVGGAASSRGTGKGGNAKNAASGSGVGSGTGQPGSGTGVKQAGKGTGNDSGAGTGPGKGTGITGGAGTGTPGSGAVTGQSDGSNSGFPDIVIQGGTGNSSRVTGTRVHPPASNASQSYGITIVASASSGGGFKDFGIFRNEAVYTVYIDMTDVGAVGPKWTLQYAVLAQSLTSGSTMTFPATNPQPNGVLAPPFPITKELPRLPPQLAGRYRGRSMVVYGIINAEGNLQDLRVLQTPDVQVNQSVLESLRRWSFRPAEMDGKRVSTKVLLGVLLDAVPQ
ncbi:MAG TPA: hypothetical protein VN622_07485 [Clostridia bacterium]|nr:hypothetical protein [Clostridia bacterium]